MKQYPQKYLPLINGVILNQILALMMLLSLYSQKSSMHVFL